jgi:glycine dehydrogenase subunit 1
LGYGGPYLGLFACKNELLRKMPGRIAGQTTDREGRRAFVLTLQAREQHIRREKATSNVCTNQALCALAATIFMSLLGKEGLRQWSHLNFQKAHYAQSELKKCGFPPVFDRPFFNEFAVRCPVPAWDIIDRLAKDRVLAGLSLASYFPGRERELLVCVTEIKSRSDIDEFGQRLKRAVS